VLSSNGQAGSARAAAGHAEREFGPGATPVKKIAQGLRVREPSVNQRRNTIVGLLRGEVTAGRGTDIPAVLAEQLLALVAEECAARPGTASPGLRRLRGDIAQGTAVKKSA